MLPYPQPPPLLQLVTTLTAELAHRTGELTAVAEERDRLLASLDTERAARLEAEKIAATVDILETELARARLPFWKKWGNN